MRIVMNVSDDMEIQARAHALKATEARSLERLEWLNRQRDEVLKEAKAKGRAEWDAIEKRMKETGKLPANYSNKTHFMRFDDSYGVIVEEEIKDPVSRMLGGFL